MSVSVSVVAACVAGVAAVVAAGISWRAGHEADRFKRNVELELVELRAQLERSAEAHRRELDEEQRLKLLVDRYQEPLVRAAFDLQSRLWNLLDGEFLASYAPRGEQSRAYAINSTAWLLGQYFGWVEIIRREVQFLRLPEQDARQQMQRALDAVARTCASDRAFAEPTMRFFRSEQRALGELMINDAGHDAEGKTRTDCLGFAAFSAQLAQPDGDFVRWFRPVLQSVEALADDTAGHARVQALQKDLLALVDLVDPQLERFPAEYRTPARFAPKSGPTVLG